MAHTYAMECIYLTPEADVEKSLMPEDLKPNTGTGEGEQIDIKPDIKYLGQRENLSDITTPSKEIKIEIKPEINEIFIKNDLYNEDNQYFVEETKIKINEGIQNELKKEEFSEKNTILNEGKKKKTKHVKKNNVRGKRKVLSNEEKLERQRAASLKYYNSLSEESRRAKRQKAYRAMTEEERERKKGMHYTYLASLTEEQLEKYKADRREIVRKHRDSLTAEQREMKNATRRKKNAIKRQMKKKLILNSEGRFVKGEPATLGNILDNNNETLTEDTKNLKASDINQMCENLMTEEECERMKAIKREKFKAVQKEKARARYYAMSEEKRLKRQAMCYTYVASLPKDKIEERKAKKRENMRKYRDSLTDEQRETINSRRRKNKDATPRKRRKTKNTEQQTENIHIIHQDPVEETENVAESDIRNSVDDKYVIADDECIIDEGNITDEGCAANENHFSSVTAQIDTKQDINSLEQEDNMRDNTIVSSEEIKIEIKPELKDLIVDDILDTDSNKNVKTKHKKKSIANEKIIQQNKTNIETEDVQNEPKKEEFSDYDIISSEEMNCIKTKKKREKRKASALKYYHSLPDEIRKEKRRNTYRSMTEEQREYEKTKRFLYLASLTEEERTKRKADRRNYSQSLTSEQRAMKNAARRERRLQERLEKLTKVEKDEAEKEKEEIRRLKKNEFDRKYRSLMSEEKREKKRAQRREYYHSIKGEKLEKLRESQRENARKYYHKLTDEQRQQKRENHLKYLASLTEEEREERQAKRKESMRKYRESLTEEQLKVIHAARREKKGAPVKGQVKRPRQYKKNT